MHLTRIIFFVRFMTSNAPFLKLDFCRRSDIIYADVLNSRFTIKMLFAYTRHYTCTCTFHRKALFLFYMVFPPGITHINKLENIGFIGIILCTRLILEYI
jgi:hypothetical protein